MNDNEKSAGSRTSIMRTELISNMITSHASKVGALAPNERFVVSDVEVDGDISTVTGEILYHEVN